MVKKLYTCDESDDNGNNYDQGAQKPKRADDDQNEQLINVEDVDKSIAGSQETDKQKALEDEVLKREIFSYSDIRWYIRNQL